MIAAAKSRCLRIAQVAPVASAVSSGASESVQSLVGALCEQLTARGHEVTLFATGDSETPARLRSLWPVGYDDDDSLWDWPLVEGLNAAEAFARAQEFDVIHCHTPYCLPMAALTDARVVYTCHTELGPELQTALTRLHSIELVAPSEHQAGAIGPHPHVTVIPHGVDVHAFPFGPRAGDYLLFLGRMIPDKGPVAAACVARAANMPLVLAGSAEEDFAEEVAPHLGDCEYVGALAPAERDRLLSGAAALLYPLQYPEPFGLVVIEAMACGTPVLACPVGAMPELVEPGVTGALAASVERLAELVPATIALDRARVRARAHERFGLSAMVERYERLYRDVAASQGPAV